jgi:hypothetical protein
MDSFQEMSPSKLMEKEAEKLKEGKILIIYKDHSAIRMETEFGEDPFVW